MSIRAGARSIAAAMGHEQLTSMARTMQQLADEAQRTAANCQTEADAYRKELKRRKRGARTNVDN